MVVIERRALVRECLARCIASHEGQRVAAFATVAEWREVADQVPASLILLCLESEAAEAGRRRGMGELARVTEAAPTVVMSDAEDFDQVMEAINRGARGFIPTSLSMNVMIEALQLVRAGGVFVPAASLIPSLRRDGKRGAPSRRKLFTARQAAVVEALRKGKANKTIAHELSMSESTVKVHVRNIMKRLRARNRTEVALMADRLLHEAPAA
jgi:DNA-binding NarL/FixJ family response regulator